MTISTEEPVRISRKSRPEGKKTSFSKEITKERPTLKGASSRKEIAVPRFRLVGNVG